MDHQELAQLLGNYGEFVGAIAVVATLAYLVAQVRYARAELVMSQRIARADAGRDVLHQLIEISKIGDKVGVATYQFSGLDSPEENLIFGTWCQVWMRQRQCDWQVMTEAEEIQTLNELIQFWLSNPWGIEFWEQSRGIFDAGFRDHVDLLLQRLQALPRTSAEILAGRVR